MVSLRSEKSIYALPRLSDVSPALLVETVAVFVLVTIALSRPFKEDLLQHCL